MVEVIWTSEALAQLEAIRAYTAFFDPIAANQLATRLLEAGDSLETFPNRGRRSSFGGRELPSIRPYVIQYRVDGDLVYILRIRHGRQLPPEE